MQKEEPDNESSGSLVLDDYGTSSEEDEEVLVESGDNPAELKKRISSKSKVNFSKLTDKEKEHRF